VGDEMVDDEPFAAAAADALVAVARFDVFA